MTTMMQRLQLGLTTAGLLCIAGALIVAARAQDGPATPALSSRPTPPPRLTLTIAGNPFAPLWATSLHETATGPLSAQQRGVQVAVRLCATDATAGAPATAAVEDGQRMRYVGVGAHLAGSVITAIGVDSIALSDGTKLALDSCAPQTIGPAYEPTGTQPQQGGTAMGVPALPPASTNVVLPPGAAFPGSESTMAVPNPGNQTPSTQMPQITMPQMQIPQPPGLDSPGSPALGAPIGQPLGGSTGGISNSSLGTPLGSGSAGTQLPSGTPIIIMPRTPQRARIRL